MDEKHIAELLKTRPRASVKIIHSCFCTLLNDAVYNGNIPQNRLSKIYIGESAIPSKNKAITLEQFKVWLEEAQQIMPKKIFAITYLTIFGLRRGEVFGIRQMDIVKNIQGRASVYLQDSRGNHTKSGRHGLKTKSSERWVAFDDYATEMLDFLVTEAETVKKKHSIIKERENDYISLKDNGQLMNPNMLNYHFEKVNTAVGFRVTPHMMRHFFTTQSIIAGVSIEALSQTLGHTKVYMTDKYNQVQDELAMQVTETFTAHISPKNPHQKSPTKFKIL